MVSIRRMQLGDALQTAEMLRENLLDWHEKYAKDYYPEKAVDFDMSRHSPEQLQDLLKVEMNYAFVAEENNKIIGIANGKIVGEPGLAILSSLAVHPNHQNKGIGKALLEKVIKYCKTKNCHKITLYTLPVLIPAVNLYLKYRFIPEAYLQREWWNVDFIKMSKWL